MYTDSLSYTQTKISGFLFLSGKKHHFQNDYFKNKAHILSFRENDDNIQQLASTVEMPLWAHLCSWLSLRLHKNDQFMELMLRISSCDTDQFSCWTLSSHLPGRGEQPQGGVLFVPWALLYSFLTTFSLIRHMACAQAGKSSLCGRTLCSFRPFLGASGQNVKRLEKVFRIIFLHWSLLPGKDGGNEKKTIYVACYF